MFGLVEKGGECMLNDILPGNILRFPMISYPSFMDDVDDLFPTANLLNGLSISEDNRNVYVEASVPGVDPKDVEVTFEKGTLSIKAESKEEEKGKTYRRKATRSFSYGVTPGDVDLKTEPKAICKNGVMTVTFAKAPKIKPKKISVKVL